MTDIYQDFLKFTGPKSPYRYCTLTEKLQVFVQHRPGSVVAFLKELICELHPEQEKQDDQDR